MNTPASPLRGRLSAADELRHIQRIRATCDLAMREEKQALVKQVAAGAAMLAARGKLEHGQFLPWLHASVFPEVAIPVGLRFSQCGAYRRACRYMAAAEHVIAAVMAGGCGAPPQISAGGCVTSGAEPDGGEAPPPLGAFIDLDTFCDLILSDDAVVEETQRHLRGLALAEIEGRTLSQLTFRFENPQPAGGGGDKEWRAWLLAHHPELCPGRKCPRRGEKNVPAAVWEAFKKFLEREARKLSPSPADRRVAVLGDIRELLSAATALLDNSDVRLLIPGQIAEIEAVIETTHRLGTALQRVLDATPRE